MIKSRGDWVGAGPNLTKKKKMEIKFRREYVGEGDHFADL
jgi:hypothetical protein